MQKNSLRKRDLYLKRMIAFQDTEMIKVMTGIRRCGKSSLMKLMAEHLRESGVADDQIIEMNFESMSIPEMDARGFYEYVKARICPDKRTYLFFDEVQKIPGWENAVNSFRVDFDCDIYITGSNAYLLSSELSTYLSGRYVEIKVLPLSFREFLDFHGYTLTERKSPAGGVRKRIMDADGEAYDPKELFDAYTRFGGMPMLADIGLEIGRVTAALDGVYSAAVINDILEREKRKGERTITDALLLRKIIMFLADNIGNNTSATSIGNTLVNEGLLEDGKRKTRPAVQTIQAYIKALTEAYFFYEIKRFDIKGKEYLRTLGKYYIVDIGLRNYLLGFREGDSGHILENIIFFELMRRGYDVAIGKIDNQEVDFIATKTDEKKYIQVTETMNAPETRERELAPLRKIRDSYEKIVIALECDLTQTQDGIKIIRALDFLLSRNSYTK
ncbi:MAG TPA: ATP-binding protein [Candidatus Blautia faecipullorum]|nr:ATP-binding protein [Candidatus Blautia faecipullorum]